jgi:hypothetical protein
MWNPGIAREEPFQDRALQGGSGTSAGSGDVPEEDDREVRTSRADLAGTDREVIVTTKSTSAGSSPAASMASATCSSLPGTRATRATTAGARRRRGEAEAAVHEPVEPSAAPRHRSRRAGRVAVLTRGHGYAPPLVRHLGQRRRGQATRPPVARPRSRRRRAPRSGAPGRAVPPHVLVRLRWLAMMIFA